MHVGKSGWRDGRMNECSSVHHKFMDLLYKKQRKLSNFYYSSLNYFKCTCPNHTKSQKLKAENEKPKSHFCMQQLKEFEKNLRTKNNTSQSKGINYGNYYLISLEENKIVRSAYF